MAKNLKIIRGNTQTVRLTVLDPESASAVQPTDTIYFTATVITKTMNASDVLDTTTGVITFKLTASETNVEPAKYVYDLVLRQADYDRVTLLDGKITIKPAATLRGF